MSRETCARVIIWLASLIQAGSAIAVLIITTLKLMDVTLDDVNINVTNVTSVDQIVTTNGTYTCLLSSDPTSLTPCIAAISVAGVSLIVALAISVLQCCTCDCCGAGRVIDAVLGVLGSAWWATAAVLLQQRSSAADATGVGGEYGQSWRYGLVVCCWAAMGSFALIAIASLFMVVVGDRAPHRYRDADLENPRVIVTTVQPQKQFVVGHVPVRY